MSETFICDSCGGEFECGRSDEEAMKEARANFSKTEIEKGEGLVDVCDDCYREFMQWLKAHPEVRIM